MAVTSAAGSKLDIDLAGATTVGVWGWTDRPGTLAHWPGGLVVSFCKSGSVNGTLVLDRGDINLTFKRYLESPLRLTLEADYVTAIEGGGADAQLMRGYLAAWGDREAYAVSHVGFGLNDKARYEALSMCGQQVAARKYTPRGISISCSGTNTSFSRSVRETVPRMPSGSQSPTTETPSDLAAMAR